LGNYSTSSFKEVGSEVMAEEMVDIADGKMDNKDEDIMLRALRVKTRGTIIVASLLALM
jgi:hypothetical protein